MMDSQSKPTLSTPSMRSSAENVPENASTSNVAHFPADTNEEKSASTLEKRPSANLQPSHQASAVEPPPDGGTTAWLQVLVGHLVMFNAWGYISSFGVFQAYYATTLNRSPSDISWIGSFQTFLIYFLSTFSGRATDAGYYHHVLIAGLALQLLGVFATSWATQYWQLFLAQGICVGLGDGLIFCPTVTLVSTYFLKKRALAISVVASGFVTGGTVFTIIARQLLYKIGFPWTMRIMGFVILANGAIILSLARTRIPRRVTGPFIEFAAFKEAPYVLFSSGMFLAYMGVFFAYYYVSTFAEDVIGISPTDSLDLLLVMNALGVPGRVVPAIIADRWLGAVNTLILFVFFSALLVYCWAAVHTISGLWAFTVIYGFFGAGVQGLFAPALANLTTDLSKLGIRIGMVFSIIGIACLIGTPIAGALISADHGGYLSAQMFGGSIMVCGASLLIGGRVSRTGFHLFKKY